jgi:methylenetetrahydrofolate dehydrogenase (NADP+)/methenyltetrahydrofolate cyclohydrolase
MILLDGKKTSDDLKIEIAESVKQLKEQGKKHPI